MSRSTVLEIKPGYNVLCTFIYIVNRVVSGEIYTAGKNFYTAADSDGIDKFHLWYVTYAYHLWRFDRNIESVKNNKVLVGKGPTNFKDASWLQCGAGKINLDI